MKSASVGIRSPKNDVERCLGSHNVPPTALRTIMYSVSYLAAAAPVPPSGGPSVSNSAEGRPVPPPHRTAGSSGVLCMFVLLQHTTLQRAVPTPSIQSSTLVTHSLRRPSFSLFFTRIANKQSKGASRQVSCLFGMIQGCPEVSPLDLLP